MFANITWTQYLIGSAIVAALYYLIVGLKYYPKEIRSLLSGRKKDQQAYGNSEEEILNPFENHGLAAESDYEPIADELFDQAQELIGKIKATFSYALQNDLSPEDRNNLLKNNLQEYPQLNTDSFRPGITDLLMAESTRKGAAMLSEREADGLWQE